jgi:flavin reductase (DIM6/NTAB) family NADH-FMN oxidoreductase RutF
MVKHITSEALTQFEKNERAHLINSLGGFKSLALIGTSDSNSNKNLAVFSSVFHVGANPPLIGLIFRPSPPERNTYSNIIETGFYTINHVNETIYKQAHQTSARYDKKLSEFDITGLNPEYKDSFFAPYVAESNIKLGVEFKEKIDLTINNTTLIIGEIKHIYLPENCLLEDGFVDIEKANTITCSGLDSYHKTVQLDRLSYAKPNQLVSSIKKIE